MPTERRTKVTLKDLAQLCGVSLGTIDRAINDKPGVSKKTRETILRIADEHGYRPNVIAQSLQSGKSFEIGLIVHDLNNRFFSLLVDSIQQTAWEHQYYIQLAVSLRDTTREKDIIEHMLQRNVDGILLIPTKVGEEFNEYLMSLGIPVTLMANRVKGPRGSKPLPFVGLNNTFVVQQAVEQIIAKGYEVVNFVAPFFNTTYSHNYYEIDKRYQAFLSVVEAHGIEHHIFSSQQYRSEIANLPMEKRSAFFCVSDIFALELLSLFTEMGLGIPEDVGVMGFDNIDVLKYVRPSLSTINYPVSELGRHGFELLHNTITGQHFNPKQMLEAQIIWRDSI